MDIIHRTQTNFESRLDLKSHDGSYFVAGIAYWREMNCTNHFSLFLRDIHAYARSFHQVVYHKTVIVETLLKHLYVDKTMAMDALLEYVLRLKFNI